MRKKVTLSDIAPTLEKQNEALAKHGKIFATQSKELTDLTASIVHIVKHMATKDDIADLRHELKAGIGRVHEQVNAHRAPLRDSGHDRRIGDLEKEVFGETRA